MKITKGPAELEHCCDCGATSESIDPIQHAQYCDGIREERHFRFCRIGDTCNPEPATPTLDKIKKVSEQSQGIGEFFDWCESEGWFLADYPLVRDLHPARFTLAYQARYPDEYNEVSKCAHPIGKGIQTLLRLFFGIDPVAEENEKRAILEYVRLMNEAKATAED